MCGDKWWGYLHDNNVVTITQQDPRVYHAQRIGHYEVDQVEVTRCAAVTKVVGPFAEDLADEFEGDIKMVRRKIMAALDKRLVEKETKP